MKEHGCEPSPPLTGTFADSGNLGIEVALNPLGASDEIRRLRAENERLREEIRYLVLRLGDSLECHAGHISVREWMEMGMTQ